MFKDRQKILIIAGVFLAILSFAAVIGTVITATSVNGVVNALPYYQSGATAGDMGASINAVVASTACATSGCDVYVPPMLSGGCYNSATTINESTKPFKVIGAASGGTCIRFTPTTGVAFEATFGSQQSYGWGLQDLTLLGPTGGVSFPTTCNIIDSTSTVYGVVLGRGTNYGAGFISQNVVYKDFGVNMYFGNNTFFVNVIGGLLDTAGLNLCSPDGTNNTGESTRFSHVVFFGKASDGSNKLVLNSVYLGTGSGFQFMFDSATSLDDVQLVNKGAYLDFAGHMEVYPNSVNQGSPMLVSYYQSDITGDFWFDDTNPAHPLPPAFISVPGGSSTVHGARFETSNPALTTAMITNSYIVAPSPFSLTSVDTSDPVTGYTVYHGTITGGASNAWLGYPFIISGFTNPANNIGGVAVASTATTLTIFNQSAGSMSETHSGSAAITFGGCINESGTNWLSNNNIKTLVAQGTNSFCQPGELNNITGQNLFNGPLMGQPSLDFEPSTDTNFGINLYGGLTTSHAANLTFNDHPTVPFVVGYHPLKFFFSLSSAHDFDLFDGGDAGNNYTPRERMFFFGSSTLDVGLIAPSSGGGIHFYIGSPAVEVMKVDGSFVGHANGALCTKSDGITTGHCSSAISGSGTCTCS